jgi:hypothetical protein
MLIPYKYNYYSYIVAVICFGCSDNLKNSSYHFIWYFCSLKLEFSVQCRYDYLRRDTNECKDNNRQRM